jgi:hypothetical protein
MTGREGDKERELRESEREKKKKVHARPGLMPHVCGAEKSLEHPPLRVSGHCADMCFDLNSEQIRTPIECRRRMMIRLLFLKFPLVFYVYL